MPSDLASRDPALGAPQATAELDFHLTPDLGRDPTGAKLRLELPGTRRGEV
jgi:hypothetical protein